MSFGSPEGDQIKIETQDHSNSASKIEAAQLLIKKINGMIETARGIGDAASVERLEFNRTKQENTITKIRAEEDLGDLDFTEVLKPIKENPSSRYDISVATKKPWDDVADMDGGLTANDLKANRRMDDRRAA